MKHKLTMVSTAEMVSNTTAATEGSHLKGCAPAPTSPSRKKPGELSGNTRPVSKEMSKLLSQRRQLMSLHNKDRAKRMAEVLVDARESFDKMSMSSNKDNDMGNATRRHAHDALDGFEVTDDVASGSPIKSLVSKKPANLEVDDVASKSLISSSLQKRATRENLERVRSPIAFFQHYGIGDETDATLDEVNNDVPDGSPYYVIVDDATNGVETQSKISFTTSMPSKISFTTSMPSTQETRSGLTESTSTEGLVSEGPKNMPAIAEAPKQPSGNIFRRFFCAVDDVRTLKLADESGEMIANQSTSISVESDSISSASVTDDGSSYRGGVGCSSSGEESFSPSEEGSMQQTTFDSSLGFVETPFL